MLRRRICRDRHCESNSDAETPANNNVDPVQIAEGAEFSDRLRCALAEISPRQAEVFALYYLEHMSYREIGRSLELKSNAVGVLLHKARESLRTLMGKREDWQ